MGIIEILTESNKHPCHQDCARMDQYGRANGFCEYSLESPCSHYLQPIATRVAIPPVCMVMSGHVKLQYPQRDNGEGRDHGAEEAFPLAMVTGLSA